MATVSGQSLINQAVTDLGILEQGSGNVPASDSASALVELNSMWDAWAIDEGLIYAVLPIQGPLVANQGGYSIGPGGQISAATLPTRVYAAYVATTLQLSVTTQSSATVLAASTTGIYPGQIVTGPGIPANTFVLTVTANTSFTISQAATASASVTATFQLARHKLQLVDAPAYYAHTDLSATAVVPDELYLDWNTNPLEGQLWPVPLVRNTQLLELDCGVPFVAFTLGGSMILPYGYQDYIAKALAWRLIPQYGDIIPAQKQQQIAMEGEKAELRVRTMNQKNRQLPAGMENLPLPAGAGQAPPQR